MATRIDINGQVAWRAFRSPETGRWIAVCDALRLTVSGETWSELSEIVSEALGLLLQDLLEDGEFETFLREHGWKIAAGRIPKTKKARRNVSFDLPFVLAPERCGGWPAAAYQ